METSTKWALGIGGTIIVIGAAWYGFSYLPSKKTKVNLASSNTPDASNGAHDTMKSFLDSKRAQTTATNLPIPMTQSAADAIAAQLKALYATNKPPYSQDFRDKTNGLTKQLQNSDFTYQKGQAVYQKGFSTVGQVMS